MLILKGSFSFLNISNLGVKKKMANKPISHFSRTHYSIIPVFHYSNRTTLRPFGPELKAEGLSTGCERSELTCMIFAIQDTTTD